MTSANGRGNVRPLGIFYEHPEWFKGLFAELDRRGIPYDRLLAHRHRFDPAERESPYSLVVNRMSPSAGARGHAAAIPYTLQYMAHLKAIGANVVNGYDAYFYEFSKANQIGLLSRLGLRHPRARAISHPSQAPEAAEGLAFPVIAKPNIGGSGAGIQKFDTPRALREAAAEGAIETGVDHVALIQEYLPPRGNRIVRVEVLNGSFLYAIRVNLVAPDAFNLCPASYCKIVGASVCDTDAGRRPLIEEYAPPREIVRTVERIAREAGIEVGGVEYLVNDRDGEVYYYDINALSNFVADAPNVVGFDPFPLLADFLLARAGIEEAAPAPRG